jgi:phosphate transport system substrate-binding protein
MRNAMNFRHGLLLICVFALAAPVCAATQLVGAGSTFDFPFFSKAFYEFSQRHNDVTVNYQSIGSGGGIEQFTKGTVDFGASDVPMNPDELKVAEVDGKHVLQIPVTLGGAAIAYNVPGVTQLKLTRELIADIYLGKVQRWNDPSIMSLNPGTSFPDMPIVTVHRSDGSGTSYIFTDFLSHVSADWKTKVGVGKSVEWPGQNGVGGKGNEGVAGTIRQTKGSIGYVELAYVLENAIPYAQVRNRSGRFVVPTVESVRAAAASKPTVSASDFSIVDATDQNAYPISGYSWAMVYQSPSDKDRGRVLKEVLTWLVTDGQSLAESVKYVPLPPQVQKSAVSTLSKMQTS